MTNHITAEALRAFEVYAADDKAACLQARLVRWQVRNFGAVPIEQNCLGASEEVGELCHAVLKSLHGIRGFDDRDKLREAAGDAIADCVIFLMQASTCLRLDFETLLRLTAERVMQRDWVTNPNDADRATPLAPPAQPQEIPAASHVDFDADDGCDSPLGTPWCVKCHSLKAGIVPSATTIGMWDVACPDCQYVVRCVAGRVESEKATKPR
jgi:NTP pyrophosphatase (non-canonical NTP hydrolase)